MTEIILTLGCLKICIKRRFKDSVLNVCTVLEMFFAAVSFVMDVYGKKPLCQNRHCYYFSLPFTQCMHEPCADRKWEMWLWKFKKGRDKWMNGLMYAPIISSSHNENSVFYIMRLWLQRAEWSPVCAGKWRPLENTPLTVIPYWTMTLSTIIRD